MPQQEAATPYSQATVNQLACSVCKRNTEWLCTCHGCLSACGRKVGVKNIREYEETHLKQVEEAVQEKRDLGLKVRGVMGLA
mgnify:CR=1 FL=1